MVDYHQRLSGAIEAVLAKLPPSTVKALRTTSPSQPLQQAHQRLRSARANSGAWIHDDDLTWLARAWGRYRTDVPAGHGTDSIAAVGAALGVPAAVLNRLWDTPGRTSALDTIDQILDRARRVGAPVCFARLAHDVALLRCDRTPLASTGGHTLAWATKQQWHTDAANYERKPDPDADT